MCIAMTGNTVDGLIPPYSSKLLLIPLLISDPIPYHAEESPPTAKTLFSYSIASGKNQGRPNYK